MLLQAAVQLVQQVDARAQSITGIFAIRNNMKLGCEVSLASIAIHDSNFHRRGNRFGSLSRLLM